MPSISCPSGIVGFHHDPVADLDQMVGIDLHAGDKGMDRVLKKQQQNRRGRAKPGKQIDRAFFDQHGDENDDRGRPHEADGQREQTVDGALFRMALLLVPQSETLDGVCRRQGQKGDPDSPQRLDDHDRDPLVYPVAPHGVTDEDQRQTRHEGNDHPADAGVKRVAHFAVPAVKTVQEGPQDQEQQQGKDRTDRE